MTRATGRLGLGLGLVLAVTGAGCKKKAPPATGTGSGSAVLAADAGADAPAPLDAAVAAPEEISASDQLVQQALAGTPYAEGPALGPDAARVVWCTAGDNGMADFREVICHFVPVVAGGKGKPEAVPVMSIADAMAIDEASYADDSADPAAKAKAEAARQRVTAAAGKVKAKAGPDLVGFGAAAPRCEASAGTVEEGVVPDPGAAPVGACTVAGLTVALGDKGELTVSAAGKPLLQETFAPRPGAGGEPGEPCTLDASHVTAVLAPTAKVLALQVSLWNPSDACALVTAYEIRAVAVP